MRRAICIGIDNYPNPRDRLGGCVNDSIRWADFFRREGFAVDLLQDSKATKYGIRTEVGDLIDQAEAGDVIAIQFSGHGTQLPDYRGDERDGLDEAIVPYDHRLNGYLRDDDIGDRLDAMARGVNCTFFVDCCHSGTITRLFGPQDEIEPSKIRYLPIDHEMLDAWEASRTGRRPVYAHKPEILFSACRPSETAKERGGQGDFSRAAMKVVSNGIAGMSNENFIDRVRAVGRFHNQRPQLWSDPSLWRAGLLEPIQP